MSDSCEQIVVGPGERQPEERLGVRLLLGDHRLSMSARQPSADPGHLVPHVLRGVLDVAVEGELEGDVADLLGAGAGQGAEPGDRAQLLLEHVGHRRFHHLGIGAGQHGRDRDDRRVDVREFPNREAGIPDDAEEHQPDAQHAGEHRPPDGHIRKLHRITTLRNGGDGRGPNALLGTRNDCLTLRSPAGFTRGDQRTIVQPWESN